MDGAGGDARPVPTVPGVAIGPTAGEVMDVQGGSLSSSDGRLRVDVPSGALAARTEVTLQEITNTAPQGVASAYRLSPHGVAFSVPVTLTFQADAWGGRIEDLTVAYQDESGFWSHVPGVVRDDSAGTLTVTTRHFSDWSVVAQPSARDLVGTFTITSNYRFPVTFTVDGQASLTFAGENADEIFYLLGGTQSPRTPVALGATTCTTSEPVLATVTNLAELVRSPAELEWGTSGHWNLSCTDGSILSLDYAFDTVGLEKIGCARSWASTPTVGPDLVIGSYTIDCGVQGWMNASWRFQTSACGQPCVSSDPCRTATFDCSSGTAVCTFSGDVANGTTCGTDMVCNAGSCVSCAAGQTCTTQPDPLCHTGVTSCSTGTSVCLDGDPLPNGTTCGTDLVCNAGTCVSCAAGQACTTQPDPLCHAGVTSCSTGTSVCLDGDPLPNGTTCGADMVCNAGSCVSCMAGQTCTTQPDPLCHTGVTSCSTGTSVCVDGDALPDGTTCGTDLVCSAGSCAFCAAGQACITQPDPLCHTGVTSCSTGTSVCLDGDPLPNGTTCGTDLVCNAGSCVSCAAGQACTTQPDPLCHAGVTSCSTGSSVCVNGNVLPDGTTCGTDLVCNAGTCVSCVAGQACTTQPDPLCHAGVTSCSTGSSVCVNGGALADGTTCGTDMVCSAGACVSCVAGLACTTQPDPLCHTGVTSCSTGSSVCVNGGALPDGTTCGTDLVCNAGTCVSCVAGQACTTNPDPLCHAGVTSCSTGTSACLDGDPLPNGTTCGTDLVCNAGTCVSCVAGQACTTHPDPLCHAGVTSCASGAPECVNGDALPNGTVCGTNQTCNAGGCVASRTVWGTRLVTCWPDVGAPLAPVPAPDVYVPPLATVAALVPTTDGGFVTYPGTIGAGGDVSIPNVPVGTYILSFVDGAGNHTFLEQSADTVDLGYDVLGRPDAALAAASTPVTLELTGVPAWAAGDEIQIASSNADVFDAPSRGTSIVPGTTALTLVDDWFASALGGPMNLLAAEDVLWIHDLASFTTTRTGDTTAYVFQSAAAAAPVSGLTLASGVPATITLSLAPAPATGQITGSATIGLDWRLTTFEAQVPGMTGLVAMPPGSVHALFVIAAARALSNPAPLSAGTPTLFRFALDAGTGDFLTSGGLSYGQFLDGGIWLESRGAELSVPVTYALPLTTTPLTDYAGLGQREAMSATPASPIVPVMLPVQSPVVNGSGAFGALVGVTPTPTLSWFPPPLPSAVPTSYTVEIVALDAIGTETVATPVATWRVASTAVIVPPGLLQLGRTYYARITASASTPEPLGTKPLSGEHVRAWARTLTATFSP